MPSEDAFLQLGPFTGGINSYSQPGAIDDAELVECMNFVIDPDGTLKCRPAIAATWDVTVGGNTKQVDAVGSAIIGGNNYVFFSNATGIYHWNGVTLVFIGGSNGVWAQSCVQYENEVYFVAQPFSVQPGGKWNGAAYTSIPAMPKGQACVIFKERMWIAPGKHASGVAASRLHFSAIGDAGSWTVGTDYFDISPGDGSNLVDLLIFNNNLLLFKQGSTFYLSYDSKPADATIVKISNTIGASNWRCVAEHQSNVYVMHETSVYQLVNFNWIELNVKCPFILDTFAPATFTRVIHTFICILGDWLICRYHNNIYVYSINTQAWTRWSSTHGRLHNFGPLIQMPADDLFNVYESYYCGSTLDNDTRFYRIKDGWDSSQEWHGTATNVILCSALTKVYSFNLPWKFKRLWSWGVEAVTSRQVIGEALPLAITNPASVSSTVTASAGSVQKKFFRFPKGLRFREIQFRVTLESYGAVSDGPAQVHTIMAMVKSNQLVPKSTN